MLIAPGWVRTDMGGPTPPLSVEESARGVVDTISRTGREDGAALSRLSRPAHSLVIRRAYPFHRRQSCRIMISSRFGKPTRAPSSKRATWGFVAPWRLAGDSTQTVLRAETAIALGSAILNQLARVAYVSRCEDINLFALLDALARPAGGTDCVATVRPWPGQRRGNLRHRLAQASRAVKNKVLCPCLCHRREQHQNEHCEPGHCAILFSRGVFTAGRWCRAFPT